MRELDYGSIIDMSLVSWMRGMPLLEAYAAAKAAIVFQHQTGTHPNLRTH